MDLNIKLADNIQGGQSKKVVTRVGPSPTGYAHAGFLRTALYNYLFAKKHGGEFYLRIEDTDNARFNPNAEPYIKESLEWLGLIPDAAPWYLDREQPKGPYRQSERDYTVYVQKLIENGFAYYAFDTPEYIEDAKARYSTSPSSTDFIYNAKYRMEMRNSLTMNINETREMLNGPYVIRFKNPENTEILVNDIIRGQVKFNTNQMDDKILVKTGGYPTYHLANVCDDHNMGTTHVIRGEEWFPSVALHQSIYKAFGWDVPEFAHLPLIMNPNGKGKLSKRATKIGIPVFPLDCSDGEGESYFEADGYQKLGYQPDAILNFLVLLGWTPKDSQEIMSLEDMIAKFELADVHKAGAKFDLEKLKHFNHHYIANIISKDRLLEMIDSEKLPYPDDKIEKILSLARSRSNFPVDLQKIVDIFIPGSSPIPEEIPSNVAITITTEKAILKNLFDLGISKHPADWNKDSIDTLIKDACSMSGSKQKEIMPTLRKLIAKGISGPDIISIMEILGRNESLQRIFLGL